MNRRTLLVSILVPLVAVVATAKSTNHVPKANTHAAVKKYVEQAAAIVKAHGPSCATFASSSWRSGDYYIFVLDGKDKLVCHPNAGLIGKAQADIVNAKGDKVGVRLVEMARGTGKGWVDYSWPRPGESKESSKSSYVMGVKGPGGKHYVVGAGGYDLK